MRKNLYFLCSAWLSFLIFIPSLCFSAKKKSIVQKKKCNNTLEVSTHSLGEVNITWLLAEPGSEVQTIKVDDNNNPGTPLIDFLTNRKNKGKFNSFKPPNMRKRLETDFKSESPFLVPLKNTYAADFSLERALQDWQSQKDATPLNKFFFSPIRSTLEHAIVHKNITSQLENYFLKNCQSQTYIHKPLSIHSTLLTGHKGGKRFNQCIHGLHMQKLELEPNPQMVFLDLSIKHSLGVQINNRSRTYRGFEDSVSREYYFLNAKRYKGTIDSQTVEPEILVLQDHHLGHNFVNVENGTEETVGPHFNLRGLWINPRREFSTVSKSGQRFNVEIIPDGLSSHENINKVSYITLNFDFVTRKEKTSYFMSASKKGYVQRPDPFYFQVSDDQGRIVVDNVFSQLTDTEFTTLEDLNIIRLIDLDSDEITDHEFY